MNPQDFVYDVCRNYVQDQSNVLGPDLTKTLTGMVRSRNLKGLCTATTLSENVYHDLGLCITLRQVEAFFKKNADFNDALACDQAAEKSFFEAELHCKAVNQRLWDDYREYGPSEEDRDLRAPITRAEDFIQRVLGDIKVFYDGFLYRLRLTSGATATRPRSKAAPHTKVRLRNVSCTPVAKPLVAAVYQALGFDNVTFKDQVTNRVVTVPKNWKTNRTIACEPEGNLPLQLAFDEYVKLRLRSFGINLSSQKRNQELARQGSLMGDAGNSLVTIDLSQASDTLSCATVEWLLPPEWHTFLSTVRSHKGRGFGREFWYHKFSSMGNGATFTLETLIFAALCYAANATTVCVYGDDIIVNRDALPKLRRLLTYFGFLVNEAKSYSGGPFRESCGTDWFDGRNVTPFYMRGGKLNKPQLCHYVNGLARIVRPDGALEHLLLSVVEKEELPLTPYSENTMAGVHIDVPTAYALKLIRRKHDLLSAKQYVAKPMEVEVQHSQTYYHWHLSAKRREAETVTEDAFLKVDGVPVKVKAKRLKPRDQWKEIEETSVGRPIVRSLVALTSHKYRRKWVRWHPPATATPVHLFRWTDLLTRN